jgi:hypothetical protein
MKQFSRIDAGFWAWNFVLEDEDGSLLGLVNRNFRGFGREACIRPLFALLIDASRLISTSPS